MIIFFLSLLLFIYNTDKGEDNAPSFTMESLFILLSPEAFPLLFIFNRVIPVAERYIEKLPTIASADQCLLNPNIRNHIQVAIFVNKSDNTIVIRILHLLVIRFKGFKINDLILAELRPIDLRLFQS